MEPSGSQLSECPSYISRITSSVQDLLLAREIMNTVFTPQRRRTMIRRSRSLTINEDLERLNHRPLPHQCFGCLVDLPGYGSANFPGWMSDEAGENQPRCLQFLQILKDSGEDWPGPLTFYSFSRILGMKTSASRRNTPGADAFECHSEAKGRRIYRSATCSADKPVASQMMSGSTPRALNSLALDRRSFSIPFSIPCLIPFSIPS